MDPTNVLIAIAAVTRLIELIASAVAAGGDISDADLKAAFDRAAAADAAWAKADAAARGKAR